MFNERKEREDVGVCVCVLVYEAVLRWLQEPGVTTLRAARMQVLDVAQLVKIASLCRAACSSSFADTLTVLFATAVSNAATQCSSFVGSHESQWRRCRQGRRSVVGER